MLLSSHVLMIAAFLGPQDAVQLISAIETKLLSHPVVADLRSWMRFFPSLTEGYADIYDDPNDVDLEIMYPSSGLSIR